MTEYYGIHYDSVIEHHGIKGQKWGVRRYQNKDGSLTEEGRKRFGRMKPDAVRKQMQKAVNTARGERHGSSNRWSRDKGIGTESEKFMNPKDKNRKRGRLVNRISAQLKKPINLTKCLIKERFR